MVASASTLSRNYPRSAARTHPHSPALTRNYPHSAATITAKQKREHEHTNLVR
jgi:hypothetical protein